MHVHILLDRSGSMQTRWDETMVSLNAYAAQLAKDVPQARVSLACFDNYPHALDYVYLRKDVSVLAWKPLSSAEVQPRGGTPLLDAIARSVAHLLVSAEVKQMFVVITDGAENASRETTLEAAKKAIESVKARDWEVVFLGADFDQFGQAFSLGVGGNQTINMSAGNYQAGTASVVRRSQLYASGAVGMSAGTFDFTDEERAAAQGQTPAPGGGTGT